MLSIVWILIIIIIITLFGVLTMVLYTRNNKRNNTINLPQQSKSNINRINRDNIRDIYYDKIEKYYDLSDNPIDSYDLSNNNLKYYLVNNFINHPGENRIILSGYNYPYSSTISNNAYSKIQPEYEVRLDQMVGNDFESYSKKYDQYNLDGFLLYKKSKLNSIKKELQEIDPNIDNAFINKAIEKKWNNLTHAEQQTWNSQAQKDDEKSSYDPHNFQRYRSPYIPIYKSSLTKNNNEPCPINETPQSFKTKTGLNCLEVCPPGKERNSLGSCVRPCPSGKERKIINGECKNI